MKTGQRVSAWLLFLVAAGILVFYLHSTAVLLVFALVSFMILFPRDLLKSPKILIWIFFIIVSISLIGFDYNARGFSVISTDGRLPGISAGDVVYSINDVPVNSEMLAENYTGTIRLETNKGQQFAFANGTLGLEAESVSQTKIKFGLDLKGGVRAVLEPNTTDNATIEQIISTLQTRINVYGLREAVFRPLYSEGKSFVEISIAGGSRDELRSLLEKQGKFEAKITMKPKVSGGSGSIKLGNTHEFSVANNSITIGGAEVGEGNNIIIDGIPLLVDTISGDKVNITATVFVGDDVKTVFFDPQRSRIERENDGYRWAFVIQLSPEGAQKFAWVTENLNIVPGGYLDAPIVLYLDDNFVSSLSIASTLKGRTETEIQISGFAQTTDLAIKERSQIRSTLESGALPTSVEIVQLDNISPTLGTGFLKNAMLAGLAAILGIVVVISIRYRRFKIVAPMVAVSLSEILIILGVASMIGWTIDLPAIAGIIAAVGTGVDSQIMIIDQALRKESQLATLKEKLGRAFFVIFGAGGTVIAAMLPLIIIGFGLLRGFAITTMIGVLVGILVARPAFGEMVKRIVKE